MNKDPQHSERLQKKTFCLCTRSDWIGTQWGWGWGGGGGGGAGFLPSQARHVVAGLRQVQPVDLKARARAAIDNAYWLKSSTSVPDPDLIRSVDPYPDLDSIRSLDPDPGGQK